MGTGPTRARRAVSAIGRGLGWLVDIGLPILYVVAIVAITRGVAEEGGLLLFLGICTVTVITMSVNMKFWNHGPEHAWRMGARILVPFGLNILLAALVFWVAWATRPTPAISGWGTGLLVWWLGMRVLSIREAVRGRAGKQAE